MTTSGDSSQSNGIGGGPPPETFGGRREHLLNGLEAAGLRLLLVTKPVDIYYLTGFRGSAGMLLVGRRRTRLWVDPRYTLQAREQTSGIEVIETREGLGKTVAAWLRKRRPPAVGYQDLHMVCAELTAIRREAGKPSGIRWKPVKQLEMRLSTGFSLTGFFFGISGDYGLEKPAEGGGETTEKPKKSGYVPRARGML